MSRNGDATRVDWAHDSAWRFFPLRHEPWGGWVLDRVNLAINKLLAVTGRDEPRDVLDLLWCDQHVLAAEALVWAAPAKDPGLSPLGIVDLLSRRGRIGAQDLARLALREAPPTPEDVRTQWRALLVRAESFARSRPPEEVGTLYLRSDGTAAVPASASSLVAQGLRLHRGALGGIVPRIADAPRSGESPLEH